MHPQTELKEVVESEIKRVPFSERDEYTNSLSQRMAFP